MNHQFWIGDSCTGSRLGAHSYHGPIAQARAIFLERIHSKRLAWPFVHSVIGNIKRPWFKRGGWPLDPLVIPILDLLNSKGINTISSCQGDDTSAPHILLACDYECAMRAKMLVENHNDIDRPFNIPLFAVESLRKEQGGQGWSIYFHDTIALMAWNIAEGVSLESQILAPKLWKGRSCRLEDIRSLI